MTSAFIKNLFAKCKMHGGGDSQVIISDAEVYALICMAIRDLGWSFQELDGILIEIGQSSWYRNYGEAVGRAVLSNNRVAAEQSRPLP
jgi:hypothetical protein